jgi:hypothetical protein
MVEKMVKSTSDASNVHEVVHDNNNHYKNMVMGTIKMNQGLAGQCFIVYEEFNDDVTMFSDVLKDHDKSLRNSCINHSKIFSVIFLYANNDIVSIFSRSIVKLLFSFLKKIA